MKNQPLSSAEQGKLLIFILVMAPSVFLIIGLIPAIFLAFGIFMMKKNEYFSSIETAAKQFKGYAWLGLIGCLIGSLYNIYQYAHIESYQREHAFKDAVAFLVACAVPLAYLAFIDFLFLTPLRSGSEWIPYNGIFSKNSKPSTRLNINSELDIIKGERLKQYSVADELLKWAKLKEGGHISEAEFIEARQKLLRKK